jgi:DTW domain-containing protein YfiP
MSTSPACEGCFLKPQLCMCSLLPKLTTKTRVVVVMHPLEARKSTNTGRLAARCLANAAVVPYRDAIDFGGRAPVVLFPVAGAQPIEELAGKDITLVALDANWRSAARMRKMFALEGIPFAKAPAAPTTYALRKGPHDDGMSTFEAIARSLAVVDGIDAAPLLRALEVFQDRVLWLRGTKTKDAVAGGIPDGVFRHQP